MDDWQRDPTRYVKRRLEELWSLNDDRVALGRLQKAFGASTLTTKTVPPSLSVDSSVANPTDQEPSRA